MQLQRGKGRHAAFRALAFKWQRIMWRCWHDHVPYLSDYSAEVVDKDFPLKEGANFLTKPFQANKLAQTIRDNLDALH